MRVFNTESQNEKIRIFAKKNQLEICVHIHVFKKLICETRIGVLSLTEINGKFETIQNVFDTF